MSVDAETKAALKLFGDALKATNHAVDGVRAHLGQGDPRASQVIQSEIHRAQTALDLALRSLQPSRGDHTDLPPIDPEALRRAND